MTRAISLESTVFQLFLYEILDVIFKYDIETFLYLQI